jgi:acyl-CoA dehydrogenase
MDFDFPPKVRDLQRRLTAFMEAHVYPAEAPFEAEVNGFRAAGNPWQATTVMEELKAKAKAEGLWNLFLPDSQLGAGLSNLEYAPLAEIMGRSGIGSEPFNCSAPDTGNMETLVRYGSPEQQERWLKPLLDGEIRSGFAMTEPAVASSDATNIEARIERDGDHYVVNGRKVWISKAMESEKVLLLTRTTKLEDCEKKTDGMTLFLTDLDRTKIDIRPIKKMGRNAVSSNELFIDDLIVPVEDRVGEEGQGFKYILDGLNPERMLVAAEALGLGRAALRAAVRYGNEREVFGRPIGKNQGIQFPLADSLARLDAAELVLRQATWLYDEGRPCGREANTAKYLCADAGFEAADRALQTHGGMGYSEEYHVARYFREARLLKIAPISQEMILNFLGSHVLGLPRSY